MIPEGLPELLEKFTEKVILEKPNNLIEFAANYFRNLLESTGHSEKNTTFPASSGVSQFDAMTAVSDSRRTIPVILTTSGSENVKSYGESEVTNNLLHLSTNACCTTLLNDESRVGYSGLRRHSVAAESFNPATVNDLEPVVHPKSVAQKLRLKSVVKPIFIFRSLDEGQLRSVIDAMKETPVTKGQIIINQGDDGDYFYVIESGTYDIIINNEVIGSYAGSGSFGELALLYNTPRAATIIAKTDGVLWALDRSTFQHIVLRQAFLKRQLYENWLSSVPLLGSLSVYERTNLADALGSHTYEDGTWIIQEGEPGEEMFFIEDGCVEILTKNSKGEEIVLKKLHKNDYFGGHYIINGLFSVHTELALILHEPRKASARAIGRTKLAVLDVSSFERLMGPCIEIMQRELGRYRTQLLESLGPEDIRNNPLLAKFVELEQ
ncbi:cAMP-dependent protein kinase type II-alpha regulatory subunit [Schistosoma japonicum]|nr:cAMP-dependent protein kinase type II-alpha regulatory subunit [Schistosoma japonicum]